MRPFALLLAAGCAPERWETSYVHTVVPWLQGSDGGWYLLDSGTPRTLLRPERAGLPEDTFDTAAVPELDIAGLRPGPSELVLTPELPERLLVAEARGEIVDLAGVVGADLLGMQPFALDPAAGRVYFGPLDRASLRGTGRPERLPVEVLGGGSTCLAGGCYEFGPTRMIVEIEVEGVPLVALVDTAATFVVLSPAAAARVGSLSEATFSRETEEVTLARGAVRLAGVTLPQVDLQISEEIGPALARLQVETGRPVEALLGQSALLRFVTEVDLQHHKLVLHPYTQPTHLQELEIVGPGLQLAEPVDGCFAVTQVLAGSLADEAGVEPGDCVSSVGALQATDVPAPDPGEYLRGLGPGTGVRVHLQDTDLELPITRMYPPG